MIRDLEPHEVYGPNIFASVLWVTAILVAACFAIEAVNANYDDYLCTNPYYKELK